MPHNLKLSDTTRDIRLSVQSRGLSLTTAYRHQMVKTLASALGRFACRIRAIHILLEDVNGPRGGVDVRCRIDIRLQPRGRFSVSAMAADEYRATCESCYPSSRAC